MINILLIFTFVFSVSFSESNVTKIDLNSNKTLMFTKGSQLELNCPLVDVKNTSFFVSWFKNKNKISSILTTARFEISFNKLSISSFFKTDSGVYHCEIVTGSGLILKSGIVNLEYQGVEQQQVENSSNQVQNEKIGIKPEFMNYYENKTEIYFEGSKIEFDCLSTGSPQPQVLWYKNNQVVSEEEYGIVRNLMLFKFKKLLLSDSGQYRCQVFNQHGEINRYFKIQVITIEKSMVKSNETISMKCDSSDSSDWFVKFKNLDYHSERRVQINSDEFYWIKFKSFSNLIQSDGGDLVLSQANVLNNGLYLCVSNGQVQSKVYDIDVIDFKLDNVNFQSQKHSQLNGTPIPVIVITVLSIVSILLIVILSMYYIFKLKRVNQSKPSVDVEKPQNQQINQASISYHVPADYFRTRRYSYVPVMPTSTPSHVYHTQQFRSQMQRPNPTLYQSIIQQQYDLALAHPVYSSHNSTRINSSMPTRSNSYRSFTRL